MHGPAWGRSSGGGAGAGAASPGETNQSAARTCLMGRHGYTTEQLGLPSDCGGAPEDVVVGTAIGIGRARGLAT